MKEYLELPIYGLSVAKKRRHAKFYGVQPSLSEGGSTELTTASRVVGMSLPASNNYYSRTVAYHEMLHARYSKYPTKAMRAFPFLACQAVEDGYVHTNYWPDGTPESIKRDTMASAIRDMRQLKMNAHALTNDPKVWNLTMLAALRACCIAKKCGTYKQWNRVKKIIDKYIPGVRRVFNDVYIAILNDRKIEAIKAFATLLMDEKSKKRGGKKGDGSSGKAVPEPMQIIELPRTQKCDQFTPTLVSSRSGYRMRSNRLVNAYITGNASGLFFRKAPVKPAGTILFDGSGSMHWDDEMLKAICRKAPSAQIAYYSTYGENGQRYGSLVIYAKDGKRYAGNDIPYRDNGNGVDKQALEWLLRQPGPRTIVTDMGFCGGQQGQHIAAHAICASAVANKQLRVIKSAAGAANVFLGRPLEEE